MKFMDKINVMTDIETMSTHSNAAIASIGACKFDIKTQTITDEFYINVDVMSCKTAGMHIDKETIKWWQEQSKEARDALLDDPRPIEEAIIRYIEWLNADSRTIFWANGLSFDVPIINNALHTIGMKPTWKYYNEMDYRTLLSLLGTTHKDQRDESSMYHNALEDAKEQARILMRCFNGSKQDTN